MSGNKKTFFELILWIITAVLLSKHTFFTQNRYLIYLFIMYSPYTVHVHMTTIISVHQAYSTMTCQLRTDNMTIQAQKTSS